MPVRVRLPTLLLLGPIALALTAQSNRVMAPTTPVLELTRKPDAPIRFLALSGAASRVGLIANVNRSMKARRDLAWLVTQDVWAPVRVAGGTIPAWMTWYEEEDIEGLFRNMRSLPRVSPEQVGAQIRDLLAQSPTKRLQTSLSSDRLGRTLRQFAFPELAHANPRRGTIYYSPAYVSHLLANAESIARYDARAFGLPGAAPPPASPPRAASPSRVATRAQIEEPKPSASLRQLIKPGPPNDYALSMGSEMPPDAVMVKVNWVPVEEGATRYLTGPPELLQGFGQSPAGEWQLGGVALQGRKYSITSGEFLIVRDEHGRQWGLMGMHIVSKVLRTWLWSSLIWGAHSAGHGSWDADEPDQLRKDWPFLQAYGLVCASDFQEGDPAPWSGYVGQDEGRAHLADTLRALAGYMNGVQWAANPYIEAGFSHTNCIGCHQLSPAHVSKTALLRRTTTNVGDFSFSITRNRERFVKVLNETSIILRSTPRAPDAIRKLP